jgi:hypothetical protein
MAEGSLETVDRGFEGSVSNLLLTDLIQLEGQNRFSGSIAVAWKERLGRLYFQGGEIVHAETDGLEGQAAVCEMIAWPAGSFSIQENVSTFGRTITKRLSHLLLDVHAKLDHVRAGRGPMTPSEKGRPAPPEENPMTIAEAIRAFPDVSYAVLLNADGTPASDSSPQAEALAAKGMFLSTLMGNPVGAAFGLGELQVAALHTNREQLLLVHSRDQALCVAVFPGASLDEVEAEIRRMLAARG